MIRRNSDKRRRADRRNNDKLVYVEKRKETRRSGYERRRA